MAPLKYLLPAYVAGSGISSESQSQTQSQIKLQRSSTHNPQDAYLTVKEFNRHYGSSSNKISFLQQRKKQQSLRLQNLLNHKMSIMHATQYFGSVNIGSTQDFRVIFDSGSGHLLVPGLKCKGESDDTTGEQHLGASKACLPNQNRRIYNPKLSKSGPCTNGNGCAIGWADEPLTPVSSDSPDRDRPTISFAAGDVIGEYERDNVCLTKDFCGVADFISMIEESDNPFLDAEFDGVLGLGQNLADAREFAVVETLFDQNKEVGNRKTKAKGSNSRENLLQQSKKNSLSMKSTPATDSNGNKDTSSSETNENAVFSYFLNSYSGEINFGRQAVEDRIQQNQAEDLVNERYVAPISVPGYWQFTIEDISLNGKPSGICKRLNERFNIKKRSSDGKSFLNETETTCQAVVDTGSSLIMAPEFIVNALQDALKIPDDCKGPGMKDLSSIGFLLPQEGGVVNAINSRGSKKRSEEKKSSESDSTAVDDDTVVIYESEDKTESKSDNKSASESDSNNSKSPRKDKSYNVAFKGESEADSTVTETSKKAETTKAKISEKVEEKKSKKSKEVAKSNSDESEDLDSDESEEADSDSESEDESESDGSSFLQLSSNNNSTNAMSNSVDLSLSPDEYLDRNDKECFITMMSVGDTGRGPLIVLGYPFLRKYYTMFDFHKNRLEFVPGKYVKAGGNGIELKGIRPTL